MSDGNLITGAKAVHANRGYGSKFDSSAAFAAGLESGLEPIKLRQAEEKQFKQAVEKKVTAWGAKLDDTIDSKNIPAAYREEINGFLVGLKDEYWHHAQVASKAEPGSDAYREAVSGMNAVNASMKNHKAQLTKYTERAYALKTANEKKQLSSGNKASDIAINSDVYGQEMPLQISGDGGLNFMNEDGSSITMDQLPEYALTDHAANLEYIKMSKTVLNSGHKLAGKLGGMQRDMINTMLRKGSRPRWLHFATDSGIADGGLGIVNPHDLSDEDLLQQVSTGLFNALSEVADEGYARKNPNKTTETKSQPPPTSDTYTVSGSKPKDVLNDIATNTGMGAYGKAMQDGWKDGTAGIFQHMHYGSDSHKVVNGVYNPSKGILTLVVTQGNDPNIDINFDLLKNPNLFRNFIIENTSAGTKKGKAKIAAIEGWAAAQAAANKKAAAGRYQAQANGGNTGASTAGSLGF